MNFILNSYRFLPRVSLNITDVNINNNDIENLSTVKFPKYTINVNNFYSSIFNSNLNFNNHKQIIQNLTNFFNSLNSTKYKLDFGLCSIYSSIHPEILKKYNII